MNILYIPKKKNKSADSKLGLLYNFYVMVDLRNVAPEGWHVPTKTEIEVLRTTVGGETYGGGKLKETGTEYWLSPNTGATNEYGFNLRGSGYRNELGEFVYRGITNLFWTKTPHEFLTDAGYYAGPINYDAVYFSRAASYKIIGNPCRLIKDDSTDSVGMTGTDGLIYSTVKIGEQVWMAENYRTTKYRNGDTIPEVTDKTAWIELATGALCAFNNDWNNV